MEMEKKKILLFITLLVSCIHQAVNGSHVHYADQKSIPASKIDTKYRTAYHFQPPRHWINDPNAPMYYKGIYHLFYQYNPYGSVWGNIVWAHSVSADLISWHSLDPAIYPSEKFDRYGCWSGSATILPGTVPVPAILYTGIINELNHQVQNVAFPKNLSDPLLQEWDKPDYNPVIVADSAVNVSTFRDPTTAWRGPDGMWRIVLGGMQGRNRGTTFLYRSKDFVHWVRKKNPLHSVADTGNWECPDFFPVARKGRRGLDTSVIAEKYVFKVSLDLTRYEYYTVGTYDRAVDRYVPDGSSADDCTGLRFDYGNFYASKSFYDPGKHRRILWGWSNESDSKNDAYNKGWSGIQTIPRALWLDTNGRQVVQWPVEEIESIRGKSVVARNQKLVKGGVIEISGILASQADVEVIFQLSDLANAEAFDPMQTDPQKLCEQMPAVKAGGVGPFGLHVLASEDHEEETSVFFRIFKAPTKYVALMCHDPSRSTLRDGIYKPTYGGFVDVDIEKNGKLHLRSLIDHSVVESFGGMGRTCITSRVYPSVALGRNARLYAFNGGAEEVTVVKMKAWEMNKPLMNKPY